jgi:hypothetical protein
LIGKIMDNKYAIIENTLVVNTTVSDPEFAQSQGWVACADDVSIGWSYVNGQFIAPIPPIPTPEEIQLQNKQQATSLLQQTDWTSIPDVANPQYSNPYLMNQDAFLAYRSTVRAIAVNPPTIPAVFPQQPQEIWSN